MGLCGRTDIDMAGWLFESHLEEDCLLQLMELAFDIF